MNYYQASIIANCGNFLFATFNTLDRAIEGVTLVQKILDLSQDFDISGRIAFELASAQCNKSGFDYTLISPVVELPQADF